MKLYLNKDLYQTAYYEVQNILENIVEPNEKH